MSNIARKHIFITDTPIEAQDWNDELEQIYSFLSGSLAGQIKLNQNSANTCFIIQNQQTGQVCVLFKQNNVSKFQILSNQQFQSLVTSVAPIDVASTTKVVGLNAQYLDGLPLSSFILNNVKYSSFYLTFLFNGVVTLGTKLAQYIVSAGNTMSLISYKIQCKNCGNSTADVSLRKNGVVLVSALLGVNNQYTSSGALATVLAENDKITFTLDNLTIVDLSVEDISAYVGFKQDLI